MAATPSTFILKPGDQAPSFNLPDPAGNLVSYETAAGPKGLLVAFVCNHCPYVVHLAEALGKFSRVIADSGVGTVAISANDVENYPQDSPTQMGEKAALWRWSFPYVYDESQEVAKAYGAACTPDLFLFDHEGKLFYAGQFDDSRPNQGNPPDGADLGAAVAKMLADDEAPKSPTPSTGCNIKWKSGNEPPYFG